ncbi:4-coumarate--CoA ligase 1 family protein [Necator americanus]|uniref:4-coumarate--CoA ligase 1 family protein n=1 Tax=Necator americanus TaxID=51031 RepID=W2TQV2_NECAM|nr:4-coumarate--CoA ligase 1 family protein [Necator americanus]ETN83407.1 4-coumarate--CoA ligase 1 family protein [Necator americanus]
MTECGLASHLPLLDSEISITSVGSLVSTFEQKIISTNTGDEVPTGERGEICIRSPTIMKGYLNRPEATAETIDADGWLHTGDIGFVDEKGQTFIVDRLKELIKVKGLQVAPAELEDILLSHKEIQDAAVIGVPDEKTGEKPRAYVVKANKNLTESDVKDFIEAKVSSYKFLTGGVVFVEEIPKSPSGKILRRFLREQAG